MPSTTARSSAFVRCVSGACGLTPPPPLAGSAVVAFWCSACISVRAPCHSTPRPAFMSSISRVTKSIAAILIASLINGKRPAVSHRASFYLKNSRMRIIAIATCPTSTVSTIFMVLDREIDPAPSCLDPAIRIAMILRGMTVAGGQAGRVPARFASNAPDIARRRRKRPSSHPGGGCRLYRRQSRSHVSVARPLSPPRRQV